MNASFSELFLFTVTLPVQEVWMPPSAGADKELFVLPPSVAPSFTLIQWRNFTRQVIKDQTHDASLPSPSVLCVVAGLRSYVTVNYGTLETDDQQELWNRERMHGRD
ncbi:hypothetical protein JOQ06_012987 [Pogonophryne albipinna]|uniref:Uncharacterized protein n=1 Tax=Pogonophryne albipinna TaxID=1090488 RepID=A0AAD6BGR2_9TELE|nr:hypothetical protein JOQ06_012987 [Pogonophryne albipinna]